MCNEPLRLPHGGLTPFHRALHFSDEPGGIGDGADAALVGWVGFEWKSFCREASTPPTTESQLGDFGSCKTGYSSDWAGDEPSAEFQSANARSYARAVAGRAVSMFYNVSSFDFELVYDATAATRAENPTEIFVWGIGHYARGVNATVSTSDGADGCAASYDGASQVRVACDLEEGTRVAVRVSAASV